MDGQGLHLQPVPGTDLVVAARPAARRPRRGPGRHGIPRASAPPGSRSVRRVGRAVVARAGRARVRRPGHRCCARPPACWRRPARHAAAPARSSSPDAASSSHARAPTPSSAAINLALALGLPGRQGCGYGCPHRPGQRAGRPGARPEGRPAPRLPDDRRPGRAGARRRRCGASTPSRCPARACRRSSCSTRSAPRPDHGRCWCTGRTSVVSAPNAGPRRAAAARPRPARGLRLRALRDGTAGRRRAARHPVGRGGGHDDQPRGPGHPAAQGDRPARGRALRAVGAGPSWPAAWARPAPSRPTPRRSSTSSPAPAPGAAPTTAASATSASTPRTALFWPCPAGDGPAHPGTPRLFPDELPHPGRPGPPRARGPPRPE